MAEIAVSKARKTWGGLLARAERGEEIVITRHGQPVARLAPSAPVIDREDVDAALPGYGRGPRPCPQSPLTGRL